LVYVAEMKSVYSAVRTGSLNKAVCAYSFRTNSDLCHLEHKLIGLCSRDEKCLQRGTDWVFKHSSLRFVFKGLIQLNYHFSYPLLKSDWFAGGIPNTSVGNWFTDFNKHKTTYVGLQSSVAILFSSKDN